MRAAFVVREIGPSTLRALNYSPFAERVRVRVGKDAPTIGHFVKHVGKSYGTVFTRRDCDSEFGVELLSQADMFAADPVGRVIRRDSMPNPADHEIHRGEILVAAAGQSGDSTLFGRAIMADGRLAGKYVGPDTVKLTFGEGSDDMSCWLYAFLSTEVGLALTRSAAYGTSIPRLRLDLLRAIPVPTPRGQPLQRVADQIRTCLNQRERYASELAEAKGVVSSLFELQEWHAELTSRRSRCIQWDEAMPTLCAWNYAAVGRALASLRRAWTGRLNDVLEPDGVFYGPRFARVPCKAPHGLPFLSQRHVFLIRPGLRRIRHPGFSDRLLRVPDSSLLVAAHGTTAEGEIFGRVVIPDRQMYGSALTQDVLRLCVRDGWLPSVYAFLATDVGFRLLRSTAVGTKILTLRNDLLRDLPFPELSPEQRQKLAQHVSTAVAAKDAADEAEGEAVRIVDREIREQWLA
jgi:hypothetical protein